MPTWLAAAAYLGGTLAMIAVRAPFVHGSTKVPVVDSRISGLEKLLVSLVAVGLVLLPVLWLTTDLLAGAERAACSWTLGAGLGAYAVGLWLLYRSHVDLGRNWSNTLQIREGHTLVAAGVYRRVRHPMYSGLLVHAVGQALVVPNWVAGPAFLVTLGLLVALRLGPEERMLVDTFGPSYMAYRERTQRLIPGVW